MDKKAVETLAVSTIRDSVVLSDRLDQFIQENDKEPSVDGFVNLYKYGGKTKENFYGRVAVQVKGTQKKISSNNPEIKYPVEISDLRFYLKEGGVVFFLVSISPDGKKRKIFYNELLPVKIHRILMLSKTQATKNLKFKELPSDINIERVFFSFYDEKQKQPPALVDLPQLTSIDDLQKENVLKGLTFSVPNIEGYRDYFEAILNCDVYMYAQIKGTEIALPVDIMDDESEKVIAYDSDNKISAGNIEYSGYKIIRKKNEITLNIENWFVAIFIGRTSSAFRKVQLEFTPRKNLRERAKDCEFMLAFLDTGGFSINGLFCDFKASPAMINESDFSVVAHREQLVFMKKVIVLFEILHIDADLIMSDLNDGELRELNTLVSAFADKKPINSLRKDLPFNYFVKIGDIVFALYHFEKVGNKYIGDLFSDALSYGFDSDGKTHFVPTYAMLDKEGWSKISNIDFASVVPTFIRFYQQHDDPIIFGVANNTLLSVLLAYDDTSKNDLLEVALSLVDWILNESPSEELGKEISLINYLQTKARKQPIGKNEIQELLKIAENSSIDERIRVGAYLLLNNQEAAEMHFKNLDEKTQQAFICWPIYRFWKNV